MWIETHKLQFAELQESGELRPTSSRLAPPKRVWKRENSWDRAQMEFGLHASDLVKDHGEEQQNLEARKVARGSSGWCHEEEG